MNDIVSTPPAPASPENSMVTTGAWWPDVDVNDLRQRVNLRGEIPHERLVDAIEYGVMEVTTELTSWATARMGEGFAELASVDPDNKVGPAGALVTYKVRLFLSAVAAHAAARLIDRLPDLTATREGSDRADQRADSAADFRRDAIHAVRRIQGLNTTSVELI